MNIPITSLCHIDWAVYADWCCEQGRVKAETFSRKVAKALLKMRLNGTDPRCVLVFRRWLRPNELYWAVKHPEDEKFKIGYLDMSLCTKTTPEVVTKMWCQGRPFWMTPSEAKETYRKVGWRWTTMPLYGPGDIDQPDRHRPVLMKFWKVLIRRSSGIPDSILEGGHDPGGGV